MGPQLYRRVVDGVILIVTKDGIGSGVVVSPKGHILTNWHVSGNRKAWGSWLAIQPSCGHAGTQARACSGCASPGG